MAGQVESGRQSKLEPFKDDILLLKKNGFSQKQIQQFLAQNGIQAGLTTINWFIRSRLQNIDSAAEKPIKKSDNVNQLTNHSIPDPKPEIQVADSAQAQENHTGKFNWQEKIDTEKYK